MMYIVLRVGNKLPQEGEEEEGSHNQFPRYCIIDLVWENPCHTIVKCEVKI